MGDLSMFHFGWTRAAFVCLASLSVGCGGDELDTVPISGIVTCQGKPVPNAQVMFNPQEIPGQDPSDLGRPAIGLTDEQGRFTLSTYGSEDGVIAGRHAVSVTLLYDDDVENAVDPNDTFPCADKTLDVTVGAESHEVKVDF